MINKVSDKDRENRNLTAIEARLQRSLKPVQPRNDFVQRFENRLVNYPMIEVEHRSSGRIYLGVIAGLIVVLSLFWFVWRFVFKKSV